MEDLPTFDILPLSEPVRRAVDTLGYTHPTPVQKAVFETVSSGKDAVVQARTGTGKTAAFGLPLVDRIVDSQKAKAQVLVLSPTRELALQIHRELESLAQFTEIRSTAVYGGAAMMPQIEAIRAGAQIIVGTPGRVLDHLERGTLHPKDIRALVLDESDEMLSMGFLPQITRIMEQLPSKRQTLLFSATLPPDVRRIAETRLSDPEFITLSGDHIGALSIDHYVYRSAGRKAEELIQIIEIENPDSAIVFCNTREQTKRIANALTKQGFAADWLNADLAQNDREKVMRRTREGKLRFLVCTDVAARGIDISHLTHVINADFPDSTENYVHRTGRTGRAGKTGTAISLIAPQDVGNLYMLRLTYKIFPVERDLPRAGDLQTRKEADLVQFLYQAFAGPGLSETDRSLAKRVLCAGEAEVIVAGLLRDHLGAHPKAPLEAAEQRRATLPEPEKEGKDEKKRKKGKVKGEKKKKRRDHPELPDVAAGAAPHEQASDQHAEEPRIRGASEMASRGPAEAPGPWEVPSEDAAAALALETDLSIHATLAEAEAPNEATEDPTVDDTLPALEVVSAAELLSEQERAMLDGSYEDGPLSDTPTRVRDRDQRDSRARGSRERESGSAGRAHNGTENPTRRIFVDVGLSDDVHEEDFLDTLADNGFPIAQVQAILVKDRHSYLGVPADLFEQALRCLDGEDVGGLAVHAEEARPPRARPRGSPRWAESAPCRPAVGAPG